MSSKKSKLVIKPFRPNAQMDQAQASKTWSALSSAIREIHNQNASSLSYEELYRNAYNLVLHKHGELLYVGVRNTVKEHMRLDIPNITSFCNKVLIFHIQCYQPKSCPII
jgi:cullin 3